MAKGGARPGAGRKPGGENQDTKKRKEALKQFKDRVALHVNKLFNSQYDLAIGSTYLYRIDEIEVKGKDGKMTKKKEHVLVEDPDEIKHYLDGDFEKGEDYYYITTRTPDNKAIDSLLNRTFGTPTQVHALDDESDPLTKVTVKIVAPKEYGNRNASVSTISENGTGS